MTIPTDRVQQGIRGNGSDLVFEYTMPYRDISDVKVYWLDETSTAQQHSISGNGSNLDFDFTISYNKKEDVKIYWKDVSNVETLLVEDTDYTVTDSSTGRNFDITIITGGGSAFAAAPTSGDDIIAKAPMVTAVRLIEGQDYTVATPTVEFEFDITILLGGSSLFSAAPKTTDVLYAKRESEYIQDYYDRESTDPWVPTQTEEAFDRETLKAQQINFDLEYCLKGDSFVGIQDLHLPPPEANKVLGWNEDATGLTNIDLGDLDSIDARLIQAEADIDNLQSRMTTAEANIVNNTNNIATNTGNIGTHETRLDGLDAKTDQQRVDINQNSADIAAWTDNQAQVDDNTARLDALEPRVDTLEPKVDQNILDISALDLRVSELESINSLIVGFWGKQNLLNNQLTPLDIDGNNGVFTPFKVDANSEKSARVFFEISRITAGTTIFTTGVLVLHYIGTIWDIKREVTNVLNSPVDGIVFTITTDPVTKVGQVQYTSSNISGANYTGELVYRGEKLNNAFMG
jgi:hypothetical protein